MKAKGIEIIQIIVLLILSRIFRQMTEILLAKEMFDHTFFIIVTFYTYYLTLFNLFLCF